MRFFWRMPRICLQYLHNLQYVGLHETFFIDHVVRDMTPHVSLYVSSININILSLLLPQFLFLPFCVHCFSPVIPAGSCTQLPIPEPGLFLLIGSSSSPPLPSACSKPFILLLGFLSNICFATFTVVKKMVKCIHCADWGIYCFMNGKIALLI